MVDVGRGRVHGEDTTEAEAGIAPAPAKQGKSPRRHRPYTQVMRESRVAEGELSDEALLAGMAVGEQSAAVAFVRRYQRRVFGLAYSMTSDAGVAEDVAQEAMIRVCAEFGLRAIRIEGRSGAWIPADPARGLLDRKIGAIGARVARGVTMHGLALNCDCDLTWFDRIVPCGIRDAGVTSLTAETGIEVSVSDVTPLLERHLAAALGYRAWRRVHAVAPLTAVPLPASAAS